MKLAIIGSRVVPDTAYRLLCDTIRWRFTHGEGCLSFDEVISGGVQGVDQLAERWVHETNATYRVYAPSGAADRVKLTVIRPDYEAYPARGGSPHQERADRGGRRLGARSPRRPL